MMIIMGVGLVVDAAGDTDSDDYIYMCVCCICFGGYSHSRQSGTQISVNARILIFVYRSGTILCHPSSLALSWWWC